MGISWTTWVTVPLIGGVIGYVTNWLAVKMIFRPIKPVNVLGIKIQGLIGRRQNELAQSIGRVVGTQLLSHEDVIKSFQRVDLEALLGSVIDEGLGRKIDALRNMPLIGGFLTKERIEDLKRSLTRSILEHKGAIFEKLEQAVEEGLDIQALVSEKVAAFPVVKLERLVLEVASRELRAIEVLGGVLGVLIGIFQVLAIVAFG